MASQAKLLSDQSDDQSDGGPEWHAKSHTHGYVPEGGTGPCSEGNSDTRSQGKSEADGERSTVTVLVVLCLH